MSRYILPLGSVLLLASMSPVFGLRSSAAAEAPIKTLSIGVGEDQRVPHPEYSTMMVFSKKEGGNLVADVKVAVFEKGERGERRILDAVSPEPWFFADLPAGKYRVVAEFEGKTQGNEFVVDGKCQKVIGLSWPLGGAESHQRISRAHRSQVPYGGLCKFTSKTSG